MRVVLIAALSALCLSAAPAFADGASTNPTSDRPDAQHFPVNNSDTHVTCLNRIHEGMLTDVVDCKTQRTWDRIRRDNQQAVLDWQLHSLVSTNH
jgi:hypothetical protein